MKCNWKNFGIVTVIILAIMLVINIFTFVKKDSAWNLETIKVGGVENMEAVQKLYQSDSYIAQQGAAINQALAQIWVNKEEPTNLNVDENSDTNVEEENIAENANTDMISKLDEIKKTSIVHGNKNARFTILEYSELLCPFCKRQSSQWTINKVLEKYPSEVNAIFRNFIVHGGAAKLWEWLKCFQELWDKDKYYTFIENAFAHQWALNVDSMWDLAKDLWANKEDIVKCIESGKYTAAVNNEWNEWRKLFGVTWTPGNVIIDKETGKFVLIPGAYPPEKFIEEIEKMKSAK